MGPVFLTGFMGSGKSTVGSMLARELGWRFVDSDHVIEADAGLSIPEIFRRMGEARFRELERDVVLRLATQGPAVIALGGGALLNPETRRAVQAAGRLVYLAASPEEIQSRLRNQTDARPLLAGLGPDARRERIGALLEQRRPIYESAEMRVDTDGYTLAEVVERVRSLLRESR